MLYVTTPIFRVDGLLIGFAAASVPHITMLAQKETSLPGSHYLTINADQQVLTSSLAMVGAHAAMPVGGFPDDLLAEGGVMHAVSQDGLERVYALTPVLSGSIVMVGLLPESKPMESLFYFDRAAYFPLLMWLASLVVGWFVVEYLVSRHVKTIVDRMRRFAAHRETGLSGSLDSAPLELRDIGDAYASITRRVAEDKAKLEDALAEKNMLLREVHHRTKNNLQLISSIMSMQARRTDSGEVKDAIRSLQDRVMALATVHKGMYQSTGVSPVRVDELVFDIVRKMQSATGCARKVEINIDCAAVTLQPDQAVPLSLLVTEALKHALRQMKGLPEGKRRVGMRLRETSAGWVEMVIENVVDAKASALIDGSGQLGFGAQLMSAYATQLNAQMKVERCEGLNRLKLAFLLQPEQGLFAQMVDQDGARAAT